MKIPTLERVRALAAQPSRTRAEDAEITIYAIDMNNSGFSVAEIAQDIGISARALNTRMHRLFRDGRVNRGRLHSFLRTRASREGFHIGSIQDLFQGLPLEVVRWLGDNTPKGAKTVDLIASIVTDAYMEEQEKKNG